MRSQAAALLERVGLRQSGGVPGFPAASSSVKIARALVAAMLSDNRPAPSTRGWSQVLLVMRDRPVHYRWYVRWARLHDAERKASVDAGRAGAIP